MSLFPSPCSLSLSLSLSLSQSKEYSVMLIVNCLQQPQAKLSSASTNPHDRDICRKVLEVSEAVSPHSFRSSHSFHSFLSPTTTHFPQSPPSPNACLSFTHCHSLPGYQ